MPQHVLLHRMGCSGLAARGSLVQTGWFGTHLSAVSPGSPVLALDWGEPDTRLGLSTVYGSSFPVPVSCCPPSLPPRTAQTACVLLIVPMQLITLIPLQSHTRGELQVCLPSPSPVQVTVLPALKAAQWRRSGSAGQQWLNVSQMAKRANGTWPVPATVWPAGPGLWPSACAGHC